MAVDPPGDTDWPRSPIDASGWSAGRVRRGSGRPIRQRAVVLAILVWLSITVGGGDGSLLAADRVASSDVLSGQCFLVWSPITILALIGLVGLSIEGPRRTGILLGLFVIMDIAVNGVAGVPTGGASFGMRRMTAMFPILAIGLAWLLQRSMSLPRVLNRSLVVASLTGVGLTMWLFFTYIRALIDPATGTVLDAVAVWLPPHTTTTFDARRSIHLFGFGSY